MFPFNLGIYASYLMPHYNRHMSSPSQTDPPVFLLCRLRTKAAIVLALVE
jgi:hypothetical protein